MAMTVGLRAGREVSTLLVVEAGDPRRDLVGRADDVPVHPAVDRPTRDHR
jgi:hypothetical protein